MRRWNLLATLGCVLALASGLAQAQTTYRLTDLGTLGGAYTNGSALNDSGQATGQSYLPDGEAHAFLWNGTAMVDISPPGSYYGAGEDINNAGQVAFWADDRPYAWDGTTVVDLGALLPRVYLDYAVAINASGQVTGGEPAFLWNGTSMQTLPGGSQGLDINDAGQVTGTASDNDGQFAMIWDGSSLQNLGTLGGGFAIGVAINASGQVTGWSYTNITNNPPSQAFLWNGTSMVNLGALLGAGTSSGSKINTAGQVIGSWGTGNSSNRAFLWNGTSVVDLGTLGGSYSSATAINDSGQVAGASTTANNQQHAFIWNGASMQDLNDLIDPADPLKPYVTLSSVAGRGINSSGTILANGQDSRTLGYGHAYIVSPVTTGGSDGDGDGINDSVDANPGTPSDAFNDNNGTLGSITNRAGLTVTIEDAASPDGVRVVVGAGSGQVTLDACGFTVTVNAASELIVTCGSVTVNVIQGAAQVVLEGRMTVISIPAGVTATTTDNGDGTFQVQNVGGAGAVSVSVEGGAPTTIAPGDSQSYTVVYPFAGFFSPVDNLPTLNGAKAGSAIPVKFSLGGNQGLAIFAVGYPKSQKIGCDSSAPIDPVEETVTAGSSSLSYAGGQYHYVWKTDKAWFGTCRQLIVKLNDATVHVTNFKFK